MTQELVIKQESAMKSLFRSKVSKASKAVFLFCCILLFSVSQNFAQTTIGGVNMGNLPNYLFVFTNGSDELKFESSSKGFLGNVAVNGITADENASGTHAYAGNMYTNDGTLEQWQTLIDDNPGQSVRFLNETARLSALTTDFNNAMNQIAGLTATAGYTSVSAISLNGLNTQNGIAQTFVINITSGFTITTKINITGDASDIFILRWDTDANPANGFQGQVFFENGGAIVPKGGLKPTNFINTAGDIKSNSGGVNPVAPYPQGPRYTDGAGALITGGTNFSGGGFFTGYWLTTGKPGDSKTTDLQNASFVGGLYSSSIRVKMKSNSGGVWISPPVDPLHGSIGDRVWVDANGNGLQEASETTGLSNITVNLRNATTNALIATTTTNSSGNYLFPGLVAGSYKVEFPPTIAFGTLSPAKVGSNDNIDSDPNQTTGLTATITLATGQNINTIDAGYIVIGGLTLGNKVFFDANRSGFFDAGDGPIPFTVVRLYRDSNNDNIPDGAAIAITTTDINGMYKFENLTPDNYIVGVIVPDSYAITIIDGGDPDNDIDHDNNALRLVNNEARGNAITLTLGGEPTGGNINNTYDFGFYNPLSAPNGGQSCFLGVNPLVFAKSYWVVNANAQTVTMRVVFAKTFVDNTYGTNAIKWPGGHSFNNLVGSDHLQWSIKDGNGVEKLRFKQDYISSSAAFPSGYGCLGFGGDGGTPTVGSTTDVLSFRTSLATNFNDFGYVLTTNSPTTDTFYTPNPTYPNWIYDVWYEVTVKASVFGTAGFGFLDVASVHASPSKTGSNTEMITNDSCAAGSIGDRVWNDVNKNGIQDAGEVGIAGVVVTLFSGSTNNILASTVTDGYGNYKFSSLETSVAGVNYQVRFSLVPGYKFSPSTGAVTVTNNSDANIVTGRTGTITLTTAVPNVIYVDAGVFYTETARLGDFVWNDLNKNGIQDAGEPGIAGVTVMLYTSANVLYRSTITSNNGYYFFNEVPAGTYYIKVTPPIGYQVSPKDAGADDVDSDIDPVTKKTDNFVVTAGTSNLTFDAGLNVTNTTGPSASLGDRVWEDLNNNNLQDAGEPGIPNVTVELFNNANVSQGIVTTDAFGNYIFNGLVPGSYYVKFTLPSGFSYVTAHVGADITIDSDPNTGTGISQTVILAADEINTTIDAGMRRTVLGAALGDFVWYDLNKNGIQDGGNEVGVPGITVLLYNAANAVVASTTTNTNGFYLFTGLPAATPYTVGFENIPTGYGFSPNIGAITVANNSDVNPATGRTGTVTTGAAGTTITYVDAGLVNTPNTFDSKGSIGDRVWNDLDNNGIQDPGEPGIKGVTVTLYASNGTTVLATTTTNALGNYLFTELGAGSYVVGFSGLPAGYIFTIKDAGSDDAKDSDADTGTGKTAPFNLASGEINLTVDAGAYNTNVNVSSLGDFVWYDLNSNGIQEANEPGVPGVSVKLLNHVNTLVAATTTSATGEYLFTDLPAGNYFIEFGNYPAGFTATTKNAVGSNLTNNSDVNAATNKTDIVILPAATDDRNWDMGLVTTTRASLGDFVWNDLNGNGIQNSGEPGVPGVTVTLYDNSNAAVAKTVTDANGFYLFSNLNPGTYSVGFSTIPASSTFTLQNAAGSTAANNSDADPATGRTAAFTLTAGQSRTDIDAGLITYRAAVGDFVWNDLNRNGIQDANEPGVPGVTVTMYKSTDAIIGNGDDVAVASAVTDANGYYFINDVSVASSGSQFYMRYTDVPTSYKLFTSPLVGGTAASNNSKVTSQPLGDGRTGFFSLSPNQIYRDMDAGLFRIINISGNLWHDKNGYIDQMVNDSRNLPGDQPVGVGYRAYLIDYKPGSPTEGKIVMKTNVFINSQGAGSFLFSDVNTNYQYRIVISVENLPVGFDEPVSILQAGWDQANQFLGTGIGKDAQNDGKLFVPTGTADVINANFGINVGGDIVIG